MGMIKSRSIIPHFPADHGLLPTPHHSGVTGIDINAGREKGCFSVIYATAFYLRKSSLKAQHF
jgi:hypothetical protein